MQLKKLQLLGFKTFADKTEIVIDNGMTAIVGPNGSGKSNIVDALLWVLGEQNPRLLRGDKAQDVIFNGTDKRKPLGMAELKLTIDNADGTLPIDFTEVVTPRPSVFVRGFPFLSNGTTSRSRFSSNQVNSCPENQTAYPDQCGTRSYPEFYPSVMIRMKNKAGVEQSAHSSYSPCPSLQSPTVQGSHSSCDRTQEHPINRSL